VSAWHDTPTVAGWWWFAAADGERVRAIEVLPHKNPGQRERMLATLIHGPDGLRVPVDEMGPGKWSPVAPPPLMVPQADAR